MYKRQLRKPFHRFLFCLLNRLSHAGLFLNHKEIYNNINILHSLNYEFNHDINFLVNKLKELEKDLYDSNLYTLTHTGEWKRILWSQRCV